MLGGRVEPECDQLRIRACVLEYRYINRPFGSRCISYFALYPTSPHHTTPHPTTIIHSDEPRLTPPPPFSVPVLESVGCTLALPNFRERVPTYLFFCRFVAASLFFLSFFFLFTLLGCREANCRVVVAVRRIRPSPSGKPMITFSCSCSCSCSIEQRESLNESCFGKYDSVYEYVATRGNCRTKGGGGNATDENVCSVEKYVYVYARPCAKRSRPLKLAAKWSTRTYTYVIRRYLCN